MLRSTRPHKLVQSLGMAIVCLMMCLPAPAQASKPGRIDLALHDVPLKEVLDALFKQAGRSYTLDPALDRPPFNEITVSLSLSQVTFEDALRSLLKAHHLTYGLDGETYMIKPEPQKETPEASSPPASHGPERLVNVEFKEVGLREAVEMLFKGTGLNYAIDPSLSQPPYDLIRISNLSLRQVPFDRAVSMLSKITGLVFSKQGDVYFISVKGRTGAPAEVSTTVTQADLEPVTMLILPMPVKDALAKLDPQDKSSRTEWEFEGQLGGATMPGAKFYKFPRKMAAQLALVATGLVPPASNDRRVTARGKVDLSSLFSWATRGDALRTARPVSIGAYRSQGKWMLTVLADRATDAKLLTSLFDLSGCAYVIGGPGRLGGTRVVSARLYDVTLDQALDALLPPLGLTYRKAGSIQRTTYIISPAGTGLRPPMPVTTRK